MTLPSTKLLTAVLEQRVDVVMEDSEVLNSIDILQLDSIGEIESGGSMSIYELMHLNLKQWAKLNNVLDRIDWSGEPDDIFTKANELYDELN